jgi:hypothetical protein
MAKLSDKELGAILEAEKSDALSADASDISEQRADAMRYYNGDMKADMPSIEGRSKAVSLDVYDTIESMLPDLVEIFASGEEVVKFNAVGPEDVPLAQQETEYVNHVFMQKNPGFLVLYSMMKDALLSKVGVVKVHWEESEDEERETYLDQPEDVFALVQSKPDVEVVEHTANDNGTHDFTIVSRKSYGCAKVEPVPPEEFGISRRARSLRDCSYCFHEVSRSEQDLIDEGFDEDQVRELPSFGEEQKEEANARDTVNEGSSGSGDSSLNTAMRPIRVTEHYIRMRYDGDSARLYRVTTGGEAGKVLRHKGEPAVVPIDMIPFAAITPVIVTHRFHGKSIADLVMEIQRIKTALLRALLDNAYLAVNPMTEVAEDIAGDNTIDDLLVRRPGGLVRVKQPGAVKIIEHPGVGDDVYPLLQYEDSVREWRTGVTKQGTGLDANALNNQSATAANQLHNAAKARLRLVARIFAETGIKDLFWLLHGTIRKNASQADTVELSNKWVTVDPRQWKTRKDLTATVGLGTGSKAEQMVAVQTVAAYQEKLMLGGLTNMVSPTNLWNTAKDLTKLAGKKDPGYYFTDPSTTPPPEPKPDPEMVKIQGQLEVEKMQARADIALSDKKLQADLAKIAAELQQSKELHQMKMQELRETNQIKLQQMRMKTAADAMKPQAGGDGGQEGADGPPPDRIALLVNHLMEQIDEIKRPKRVRRLEDGSWVSEPVH